MNLKSLLLIVKKFNNYPIEGKFYNDEIPDSDNWRVLKEYDRFVEITDECTSGILQYDKEIREIDPSIIKFQSCPVREDKKDIYFDLENKEWNAKWRQLFKDYDSIFIVTPWLRYGFDQDFHLRGGGGYYYGISIAWLPSWIEGFHKEREIGEAFIHEWLHGITGYLFRHGLNGNINPDNSKEFKHIDENKPYLPFYKELMTKNLKSDEKENLGITKEMWHKYARRIR